MKTSANAVSIGGHKKLAFSQAQKGAKIEFWPKIQFFALKNDIFFRISGGAVPLGLLLATTLALSFS